MRVGVRRRCMPLRCGGNIVGVLRISLPCLTLEACEEGECHSESANKINCFYEELEATYITHFTALFKFSSHLDVANAKSTDVTVSVDFTDVSEGLKSCKRRKKSGKFLAIKRSCTFSYRGEKHNLKPCLDVFDISSGEVVK